MRRGRPSRGAVVSRDAGAILLDVAVAISVLVVAGLVILNALGQAIQTQRAALERARLMDLARSAIALIESGAASAESLNGPVRAWPAALSGRAGGGIEPSIGGAEGGPQWSLRVETRPFGAGEGLAVVTVEAKREGGGLSALSTTLRQVVRMVRPASAISGRGSEHGSTNHAEPWLVARTGGGR